MTTNDNEPRCFSEWSGLLSTQDFSNHHPDHAYHFLKRFESYLRKRIWIEIENATLEEKP